MHGDAVCEAVNVVDTERVADTDEVAQIVRVCEGRRVRLADAHSVALGVVGAVVRGLVEKVLDPVVEVEAELQLEALAVPVRDPVAVAVTVLAVRVDVPVGDLDALDREGNEVWETLGE